MNQYCVVVANGKNARFFTLEDSDSPEIESGPNLVKLKELSNPEHSKNQEKQSTDSKSGGNRGHGGQSHGYDDHRSKHEDNIERRFANAIADECKRFHQNKNSHVVLVSQKRMLGHLRSAMESRLGHIKTQELAKDLCKLNAHDIHLHLAKEQIIPRRRPPSL
ncbi:MAG: host attachment protein [Gammaproteobacteria bacterium]|nr:host attachment protein [Gammaproteobacteria bacterium]